MHYNYKLTSFDQKVKDLNYKLCFEINEMLGNSLNNVYAVKYLFIYRNYACIYTKSCFIMVLRLINMYVCETRFKLYVCLL